MRILLGKLHGFIFTNVYYNMTEIIHEQQRLQLCAIHTVNNLLQLTDDVSNEINDLNGPTNHRKKQKVSKSEFDAIADYFTSKEHHLCSDDNLDEIANFQEQETHGEQQGDKYNCSSSPPPPPPPVSLTLFQKLSSNHRTPILGNYSYEVLETVLKRRGVQLTWHKVENDESANSQNYDQIIGFVLNISKPRYNILRYIPYLKNSRHWFCIVKARQHDKKIKWIVLDSDDEKFQELSTEAELLSYLLNIKKIGGNIFKASMN